MVHCVHVSLECVTCIHRLIGHDHIERQNYVQAAVRWSRQVDKSSTSTASTASTAAAAAAATSTSTGHPSLHAQFALTYWQGISNNNNNNTQSYSASLTYMSRQCVTNILGKEVCFQ